MSVLLSVDLCEVLKFNCVIDSNLINNFGTSLSNVPTFLSLLFEAFSVVAHFQVVC
jgi:hypothetical protein